MRAREQIALLQKLKFDKRVLSDDYGVIVVPTNMKYKSGWGATLGAAAIHCFERNNLRV